jgi:hypothetical protein
VTFFIPIYSGLENIPPNPCPPGASECDDLIWNRVFTDIIKLRIFRMGPKIQRLVFLSEEKWAQIHKRKVTM